MTRPLARGFGTAAIAAVLGACIVSGSAGALTTSESGPDPTTATATGGSTGDATASGSGPRLDVGVRDVEATECASVAQTTTITEGPSDIIVVVDRAMQPASTDAILVNFAQYIANENLQDVQVLMVAGYPPDGVCIDEPPLGYGGCPTMDDNPPIYRHFDVVIEGSTLLTQLLDAHDSYGPLLRSGAGKHVFVLASSDSELPVASFDESFRGLDPSLAGYVFHAVAPDNLADTGDCGGVAMGETWSMATEYAALAAARGGVFENACNYEIDRLFEALLTRVREVALSCDYDIPPAPDGMVFDDEKVNVDYDDGSGMETIGFVPSASECAAVEDGWYYDDPLSPDRVLMCPQTCARFEAAQQASIEIRFGCTTIPAG